VTLLEPSPDLFPSPDLYPGEELVAEHAFERAADAQPTYRFILCRSPRVDEDVTAPLERIGELTLAGSRKYDVSMNKGGSAGFSVPILHKLSRQIKTMRTCIMIVRDNVPLWSGPVWTLSGSLPNGVIDVSCVGWLERLNYRELREDVNYAGDNPATGEPWTDFQIVADVFDRVISYDPAHPPPVVLGGTFGTPAVRTNSWAKGTKVAQVLSELSDVESGFDYIVDPVTRELNLYSWDTFTDRPEIHYGYGIVPYNVSSLSFNEDSSTVRNRLVINGTNTFVIPPQEIESQDVYGLMEETVPLTGVADPDTLAMYGIAELAVKREPMRFYEIVPFPFRRAHPQSNTPQLFVDYDLRDVVRLSVDYGFVREKSRPIRVYGASVTITENGDEVIDSLTTSYAPGPAATEPEPAEAVPVGGGRDVFDLVGGGPLGSPWIVWRREMPIIVDGAAYAPGFGPLESGGASHTAHAASPDSFTRMMFTERITVGHGLSGVSATIGARLVTAPGFPDDVKDGYVFEMQFNGSDGFRGVLYKGVGLDIIANSYLDDYTDIDGIQITTVGVLVTGLFLQAGVWNEIVLVVDEDFAGAGAPGFGIVNGAVAVGVTEIEWGTVL